MNLQQSILRRNALNLTLAFGILFYLGGALASDTIFQNVPRISTELQDRSGDAFLILTIKNTTSFKIRLPRELQNSVVWQTWYSKNSNGVFSVEKISGPPGYGVEKRKGQLNDLYAAFFNSGLPIQDLSPGEEARFEFSLQSILEKLEIGPRSGQAILLQAQISNAIVVLAPDSSALSKKLFNSRLYSKRLQLNDGVWTIFGSAR